jgi:hypothetical protein
MREGLSGWLSASRQSSSQSRPTAYQPSQQKCRT